MVFRWPAFFISISVALAMFNVDSAAQSAKAPTREAAAQADAAFRAGYAAREAGHLDAARVQFAQVVKLAPQIAEGHEALGAVLLEMAKPAEAGSQLEIAARLKPNDTGIETNLALAYTQSGQPAKSLSHFKAALSLARLPGQPPTDPALYDSYARALASEGQLTEALAQFAAEEQLIGPRADIDDGIGTLDAQLGRWDEAQHAFERAIAADGANERARIHLGVLLRQRREFAAALAVLEPAAHKEPPAAAALLEYGRTLAAAGQDEGAVDALEQAIKISPSLPGASPDLAMALQRLGRQQEAIPWFHKALQAEPGNADVLTNLALAMTLSGKAKDALPYLDRAQVEKPNDPTILKDRGVAHIQLSAFDEAIIDFQAALALDSNDPQLHYDLGLAYKLKDRTDDAVTELARAERMDPALEDPPYTLGILFMQMGKLDDAVVELKKAVVLRPENGNAWAILGSTLKQASRLDEARAALERAIPLQPGQPGPLVTLAGVLAEQAADLSSQADAADGAADHAKAEQLRDSMTELRSQAVEYRRKGADLSRSAVSRQRASFALNAGNQLMLRGQIADAVSRYQESIAADPTFAEPHIQLAIAYDRQGRTQDAAAERAKGAGLSPAN
jgi:protein O-GlcNAc transferase